MNLPFSYQFSTNESSLLHHHLNHRINPSSSPSPPPLPPTPPPPPSMSPSTDTWTTTTSTTNASALPRTPLPPPPPPPPPIGGSTWDFWDPFVPSSVSDPRNGNGVGEQDWEEEAATVTTSTTTTTVTPMRAAANVAAPPSVVSGFSKESEMAVVVSRQGKELVEIIKELDEYFLRAADAGAFVSGVLEVHSFSNLSTSNNFNHHHFSPPGNFFFFFWFFGSILFD